MGNKIHIIGGGTFSYVRNHLALAAPAFGSTAAKLHAMIAEQAHVSPLNTKDTPQAFLHLTAMATGAVDSREYRHHLDGFDKWKRPLVTNDDVAALLEQLTADPETRVIILNAALCDYEGHIMELGRETESGSHEQRLKTVSGTQQIVLTPADKLIGQIRKTRKDIFVVGFKTTTNASSDDQYKIALNMLKANSLNLVLANDTVTRNNMIVAPEETRYHETTDRDEVLSGLVKIVLARSKNTFTRSTVVEGPLIAFNEDPLVPENLRAVVNHCLSRGAYKPFRGSTAGHFAVKVDDGTILTSIRKTNYNKDLKLVRVDYDGDDRVIAHGAKPSVGGQSQRAVFAENPDLDCIVHFHCPLKAEPRDFVPVAPQWQNECGSHQCGLNTAGHLSPVNYGRDKIKVVMLDGHGPNIVFSRDTPAEAVINFIEHNFSLEDKTGGWVS